MTFDIFDNFIISLFIFCLNNEKLALFLDSNEQTILFIIFAPIFGFLLVAAFAFYWIIIFPIGIAGGLAMYFTNLTCLFEVDQEACEAKKNESTTDIFFSGS